MGDYAAYQAENLPMSQPETDSEQDSDSDTEDLAQGAPDMQDFISAKQRLAEMNSERKDLMETVKRKRDELEQYMLEKDAKTLQLEGMIVQMKKAKKISWNEKALREHVDEDGKLDLDLYKSSQTQVVEKMSIKLD